MSDQAVVVHFTYAQDSLDPLYELEEKLVAAIEVANAGEFDGHEIAMNGSDGRFYMYGPNADRLFAVVLPILASATCIQNAVATLRYGPPEDDVRKKMVAIESKQLLM